MPDAAKEAALAAANDLFQNEEEEQPVEGEAEASEQPEGSAVEQSSEDDSQHEAEEADSEKEELEAWLEEPDEQDVEEALTAEEEEDDEEWDDEKRELRKKILALEKKAAFQEKLRADSERKNWEKEVNKHYPYADAAAIQATSKRAFLRQARADHEAIKTRVDAGLEAKKTELEAEREQIRAEVRAELEAAWGKPTTGPGVAPARSAENSERVAKAFQTRGIAAGIREMMRGEGGD